MKIAKILVCLWALAPWALADNATIAVEEIPQPVKDIILSNYPKAVLISAEKKAAEGDTLYAVRFKVIEKVRIYEVTSDGIVKKVEEPPK